MYWYRTNRAEFQSTHPVWGATPSCPCIQPLHRISIHAPRVGCDLPLSPQIQAGQISIHAPRVGCDQANQVTFRELVDFNPRTPCGVRHVTVYDGFVRVKFQSTHPVWGATRIRRESVGRLQFQSTHPVWGATGEAFQSGDTLGISIHAPRVGCDGISLDLWP